MNESLKQLINISRYFGKQKDYVIGGGGNTSVKDDKYIWIKASGSCLAEIDESGLAQLDREKLKIIGTKQYNDDARKREEEVLQDMLHSRIYPEKNQRPSVETSFHEAIEYKYVVHTHPTIVNALMCSNNSEKLTREYFGDKALYLEYNPGYSLFKNLLIKLQLYRQEYQHDPKLIFLQNHGIFISSDSANEIKELYKSVSDKIKSNIKNDLKIKDLKVKDNYKNFAPAIRMMLSDETSKIIRIRHNTLVAEYYQNMREFVKISNPFIPDMIVYCKGQYLFLEAEPEPVKIINTFKIKLENFVKEHGYKPKIIVIKNYGVLAIENSFKSAELVLDVFEDLIKVSHYSQNFGGPRFLEKKNIDFIDNWEVENFRRKISSGESRFNITENKICIITGAAKGFGRGIAENLYDKNANIVIADIDEKAGKKLADDLKSKSKNNQATFIKTNVSDPVSVDNLITETVKCYGGLDIYISNAGILKAGSLEDISPEDFNMVTKVNYTGYYLGVKYASEVMKLQSHHNSKFFMDIIQINSKSGLKGSNKNFAYAGSKFGGIGLTQSFALELIPFNIKVNAICPGNYFDGPLWSDPEHGLFIQYLKAGKVPEASTIDDVKMHYENQVPFKRGCRIEDVMKAIYYVISQEYETGQAIPVTGGQIMLS